MLKQDSLDRVVAKMLADQAAAADSISQKSAAPAAAFGQTNAP